MRYVFPDSGISSGQEKFPNVQKVQALRAHFGIGTLYGWRIFQKIFEDNELPLHPRENYWDEERLVEIKMDYERYMRYRIIPWYVENTFDYRIKRGVKSHMPRL